MNLISDTLRSLVQRKLWPVALLLVAALVAVPLTLSKHPAVAVPPASVAPNAKNQAMPATFVSADEEDADDAPTARRRVLGQLKDPFEPKALPKVKKAKAKKKTGTPGTAAKTATPTPAKTPTGSGGGTTTPTAPTATATPAPTITIPAGSIKVRFGITADDAEPTESTLERLSVLPDDVNPVLAYSGVEDGGKVAIFQLSGTIVAVGDGECLPTPENCQSLKLHAGETEFLTVSDTGADTDAQYQLDLVKIYRRDTKEAVSATATPTPTP